MVYKNRVPFWVFAVHVRHFGSFCSRAAHCSFHMIEGLDVAGRGSGEGGALKFSNVMYTSSAIFFKVLAYVL